MKIRSIKIAAAGLALIALGAACADTSTQAAVPTVAPVPTVARTVAAEASAFAIVAEASEARYRVTEQLAGRSLPNDAVGATKAVTGAIVLGPDGQVVPGQSKVTVDLSKLESDSGQRDNFVKRNTLQVSQFPNAEFVPTRVEGLPRPRTASRSSPRRARRATA